MLNLDDDHPYVHVTQRFERAKQLLIELDSMVLSYYRSDPIRFSANVNLNTGLTETTLDNIIPIPPACRFLAGEVIQHARGCLDNLAYVIGSLNPGLTYAEANIAWPIYLDPLQFELKRNAKSLKMFAESDMEQIKALNPISDGVPELWVLHQLNNIDKHRIPLKPTVRSPRACMAGCTLLDKDGLALIDIQFDVAEWKTGMVVARSSSGTITFPSNVTLDIELPFIGKTASLMPLLYRFVRLVEMMIGVFVARHSNPEITAVLNKACQPSTSPDAF